MAIGRILGFLLGMFQHPPGLGPNTTVAVDVGLDRGDSKLHFLIRKKWWLIT